MKKNIVSLFISFVLILQLTACGTNTPIIEITDDPGENSEIASVARPAYEIVEGRTASHRSASGHKKAFGVVSAASLELELETAYGFDLEVDEFSDSAFADFYKRNGYDELPDEGDAYVLNIMTNIKKLFPAIPSEIVRYMDESANLTILVGIDEDADADGVYYPESNMIYLMYEGHAVVHEYGHMLHYAIMSVTGENSFERQWTALNEGLDYNDGRGGKGVYDYETGKGASEAVFYGDYATTDIFEDVAETFWMMIERPDDLQKFISAGSPLAKKASLLNSLLQNTLLKADTAIVAGAFAEYADDEYWDEEEDYETELAELEEELAEILADLDEEWYDEDWWSWNVDDNDIDGDGYCDDCGEWLGDDDWDEDEYDIDGDGYCDDCGEWLG